MQKFSCHHIFYCSFICQFSLHHFQYLLLQYLGVERGMFKKNALRLLSFYSIINVITALNCLSNAQIELAWVTGAIAKIQRLFLCACVRFSFLLGLCMYQYMNEACLCVFIYRLNEYINSAVFSLYSETPVFSTSFTIKTVCVHIHHFWVHEN